MTTADAIAVDPEALAETKAYLRIETGDEDALLTRLIAAAIAHGEAFTGQLLVTRAVEEAIPAQSGWHRLSRAPVAAITAVRGLPVAADPFALATDAYAIDIDASGDGWVRVADPGSATRAQISYSAGIAAAWAGLPEPLRQGVIRLASHLYAQRDATDEGAPPAAVAALWRPWRRMRLT